MARFIGVVQGSRSAVSRLGTAKTGMSANARGWNLGGCVSCYVDGQGNDCVSVSITGGSNNSTTLKHIGTFKLVNGELVQS